MTLKEAADRLVALTMEPHLENEASNLAALKVETRALAEAAGVPISDLLRAAKVKIATLQTQLDVLDGNPEKPTNG